MYLCQLVAMFQSTRPRRARPTASRRRAPLAGSFNPRARGGRDTTTEPATPAGPVSIHAPAEGATRRRRMLAASRQFQSTRPRRARPLAGKTRRSAVKFQSTRPRRARPVIPANLARAHRVSIHAPAEGATVPARNRRATRPVSIHAPAEGATGYVRATGGHNTWFQSTRPRRARPRRAAITALNAKFQSTRPRRARRTR